MGLGDIRKRHVFAVILRGAFLHQKGENPAHCHLGLMPEGAGFLSCISCLPDLSCIRCSHGEASTALSLDPCGSQRSHSNQKTVLHVLQLTLPCRLPLSIQVLFFKTGSLSLYILRLAHCLGLPKAGIAGMHHRTQHGPFKKYNPGR